MISMGFSIQFFQPCEDSRERTSAFITSVRGTRLAKYRQMTSFSVSVCKAPDNFPAYESSVPAKSFRVWSCLTNIRAPENLRLGLNQIFYSDNNQAPAKVGAISKTQK